jgi:hypothetical protein
VIEVEGLTNEAAFCLIEQAPEVALCDHPPHDASAAHKAAQRQGEGVSAATVATASADESCPPVEAHVADVNSVDATAAARGQEKLQRGGGVQKQSATDWARGREEVPAGQATQAEAAQAEAKVPAGQIPQGGAPTEPGVQTAF